MNNYLYTQKQQQKFFQQENNTNLKQVNNVNNHLYKHVAGYPVVYDKYGNPIIMNGAPMYNYGPRPVISSPFTRSPYINSAPSVYSKMPNGPNTPLHGSSMPLPRHPVEHFSNTNSGPGMQFYGPRYPSNLNNPANQQMLQQIQREPVGPPIGPTNPSTISVDPNERPVADFMHNNMVPFTRKYTQNMKGTGVPSGNYVDGVNVDTGADKSTPLQTRLSLFTGLDVNYRSNREAGPMFSPAEQQTNWVYGTPLFRPDTDVYTRSLTKRNDLRPVEPEMVGRGLNLDPSIPAAGGFHEFTRVMPNNVTDYKANQLEGRVNAGKFVSGASLPSAYPGIGPGPEIKKQMVNGNQNSTGINPTSGALKAQGVPKNRPPRDWSQARYPTMTTKVGFIGNMEYVRPDFNVDKRPANAQREQTSFGYGDMVTKPLRGNKESFCVDPSVSIGIAPARPSAMSTARAPTFMSLDNNVRSHADCNSVPINAPSRPNVGGPLINNFYVNETDRGQVNPQNASQLNLKGQNLIRSYNYDDDPKTTMKETTEFAYAGDPNRTKAGTKFVTWTDPIKTTMKETTEFAYAGDPQRTKAGTKFITWTDPIKTTMKETTEFAYAGDPNRQSAGTLFKTWADDAKPTIKQSTSYSYTGDANVGQSNHVGMSRFQFTGSELKSKSKPKLETFSSVTFDDLKPDPDIIDGGADTFTIRGSTLVLDYMPGPGRANIRQNPENIIGKVDFGTFGNDNNTIGPGTYNQARINGTRYQNSQFIAAPQPNPNKIVMIDDRQLASYQTQGLRNNPLSIYTQNERAEIPDLFIYDEPDDYADLVLDDDDDHNNHNDRGGSKQEEFGLNVYPQDDNDMNQYDGILNKNPNSKVVYNDNSDNPATGQIEVYNPMISQGSSRVPNSNPTFSGHGYSGPYQETKHVYGPRSELEKYDPQHDKGIINGPLNTNQGQMVCEPNKALDFAGGVLILDKDLD